MSTDLSKESLTPEAQQVFSVQSYESKPSIEGVVVKDLPCFVMEDGYFMELGRFDDGVSQLFPDFKARQMSYSQVLPGSIKAFHIHFKQDEYWFVAPHERLLLVLSDQRENSPTKGVNMKVVLGGGKSRVVFIPKGVAHGVANSGSSPGSVIYFTSHQFDGSDEGRLPWDFVGKEIWEVEKG